MIEPQEVFSLLPYTPNEQQVAVVEAMLRYCDAEPRPDDSVFILNGYAGTGKTSLTGALVKTLEKHRRQVVLLAPTGRAAKVFSANSGGHQAFTIHRKIYRHAAVTTPGSHNMLLPADNRTRNAVFIVDEASMISGDDEHGSNLLEDLLTYVFGGDNSRLIFIGDTAQLPPVGSERSAAMNPEVLRRFGLKVSRATLTETARQAADSGILFNATRLRKALLKCSNLAPGENPPIPQLRTAGFDDVIVVDNESLPDYLSDAYNGDCDGLQDTIMITRSNQRACDYNAAIRSAVLYREEELTTGDMLIVARNRYFTKKVPGVDFIANGDVIRVEKVFGTETRYGFRFADVRVSLVDSDAPPFEIKILLDTLNDPAATMSRETWNNLYYGVMSDNERYGDASMDERLLSLRSDPYWTALVVKYAYAVTCHKAQGGQWNNVFVDLSYIPDDALGAGLYRWFYTAVTRARRRLYLIAPPEAIVE